MDRRAFFRRSMQRIGESVTKGASRWAEQRAVRWIRPPFAISELEFLMACTRCQACVEACPHGVVFPLSARCGASVAATPALDVLNRGCRLCEDWPCVQACETGALCIPSGDESTLPQLALARIDVQRCLPYLEPECGACASSCSVEGALQWDGPRPWIETSLCVGCGCCREACIVDPSAIELLVLSAIKQKEVGRSAEN